MSHQSSKWRMQKIRMAELLCERGILLLVLQTTALFPTKAPIKTLVLFPWAPWVKAFNHLVLPNGNG